MKRIFSQFLSLQSFYLINYFTYYYFFNKHDENKLLFILFLVEIIYWIFGMVKSGNVLKIILSGDAATANKKGSTT